MTRPADRWFTPRRGRDVIVRRTDTTSPNGFTRRNVLAASATGLGIALDGNLEGLFGTGTARGAAAKVGGAGYGPLIPDPAGLLSLPEGFTGEVFFFARNEDPGNSEFCGPTFSRDKKTLFACIQTPGWVVAIQGPFRKQR